MDPVGARHTQSLIFAGYARLPKTIAGVDSCVGVQLEVESDTVVELACRAVLPRTEALLREVLIGRPMVQPIESALDEVQKRYFGADVRAICTAVQNAHAAYLRWREGSD